MTRRGLLAGVVPAAALAKNVEPCSVRWRRPLEASVENPKKPKRMYATLDYQDLVTLWLHRFGFFADGTPFETLGSAILSGDFDERGIEWR